MQSSTTSSTSNQWVHLTLSVDESNSNVKFYQDGNLINTFNNVALHMNNSIGIDSSPPGSKNFKILLDNQETDITIDDYTDSNPEKTPWILALNYIHKGGTSPALNVRDTTKGFPVLPADGSLDFDIINISETVPDGSVEHPNSWGHTGNVLFDKLCSVLGSVSGEENGVELRFLAKTNDHTRIIHFKTSDVNMIKDFRYGNIASVVGSTLSNTVLYNNSYNSGSVTPLHSAELLNGTLNLYHGSADESMVNQPLYISSARHWGLALSGVRWEVDNYPNNNSKNTYHQIWVRANNTTNIFKSNAIGSLESMLVGSSIMTNSAFKGSMDDVTIHEDTLTDEQVNAVYNASLNSVVPTIPLNEWSHIAVNHNIHKKQLDMYLNGELCGVYGNFNGIIETNTNEIKLGEGFVGEMSETVLFQRPLTKTEIKALASDPKRHQKGKGLISANFASVEPMSTTSILNKSGGESNLELRSTASYKPGHESGARALEFNGTQMGTLNLSDDGFIFNTMLLQSKLKLDLSTGSHQSITRVPGVFDWYIDTDGKPTFAMDGDSTEYKMNNVLQNNKFIDLKLEVNKYTNNITFTESDKFGWVLLNRDVVGEPNRDTTTLTNVGSYPEDFSTNYSLLGDLKDGTGEMIDDNIKVGGNYKFRLIPYNSIDERLVPNNTERYIEWTQESNPTTTATVSNLGDYVYAGDLDSSNHPFGGLRIVHSNFVSNTFLAGDINPSASWYYPVGVKTTATTTGFLFSDSQNDTYKDSPTVIELWVWKGPKVPTKPELPNFTPTLTLPPSYTTPSQRSTIDITLDDGTKQTMEVTTDTVTDADPHRTPWILALNYLHKGGTNPALDSRTTTSGFPVLSVDGNYDFDNVDINGIVHDGSYYSESWGHTGNDLFNKLCVALGSDSGNENGIEVRMRATSSQHGNMFHMKLSFPKLIEDFRYGNAPADSSENLVSSLAYEYPDHNTALGANTNTNLFLQGENDQAWTMGPINSIGNDKYWRIGDYGQWLIDNHPPTSTAEHNTYHQIWVRALNNKPTNTALTEKIENVNINMNSSNVMYIGSNLTGSMSEVNVGLGFHVPHVVDYSQTKMLMNFSFDESSTEVAIDTSAFGNNGTLMNGAVRQYGTYDIQSKGVKLDASQNQYVNIPGAAYSNISFNTCTMSAWVFTSNDGTSADKKDILKRDGAFEWYIDGSGVVKYMDLDHYEGVTSSITIDENTWTHLGIVLDEYANNMTFYKDGILVESIPATLPIVFPMSTNDIQIGNNFTGVMDNVIVHLGKVDITANTSLYSVPDNSYNPETITENEWAHVACVYKKETNTTTVYHNGQVIGYYNSYLKDFTSVGKNVNNMYIAATGDNATFYDGIIDDVRVYKTALTDEDIAEMFSQYKFYDRYFNIETSLVSASFTQNNIVFDIVLNEPAGKAANNSINYFAFPVIRALNGKSEVEFLLKNIDSLNVNLYDMNLYTTAGSAKETAWNITLTKAISGNLTDEADLSDVLYLYLYVVAKDYEGNVDYIYKQVQVTLPSHSSSCEAEITESNSGSEVIALTEGSVISAKQYLMFAFNGQISLEKAKLFTETHLLPNISTNTGGTMNNVYGHSVYSYKVSTTLPTPTGHLIETGITLANAFQTTTSSTTTPVPISSSGLFTTYMVSCDTTNIYHVITSGMSSNVDPTHTPIQFLNEPVLQTPPTVPLKVKFDISEPSSTGVVTVSSGEIIVGTQVPMTKFVVFAISGNTKGKDVIRSFYNNNLSSIDTSSDTIYVNTAGNALGSTVDLSTLNIVLTKMYTGIDGVTDTAITAETILMNVYIVTVNKNNDVESVAEGLFPVYDPIDVNYTSLTKVNGANEWFEGSFHTPLGDGSAISTDGQFMANTVQYMNNSWTPIAKPGKVFVSKNSAAPGEDYQYKAYQMIEPPADVGQVLGTSATNVSHVDKVSFSHDGAYLSVAGSNWVLIYKRNDDTNQYELYEDITPKFTQVTLAYGYASWVPYNYYANKTTQLSATGDCLLVAGVHGQHDGTDDITTSVWINNGSGFDLYQDGGMKTLRPSASGAFVRMSGDDKTIIVSGSVGTSSGLYQIGFRVYRRNNDTGRYEHTQYARYANYATGIETEENTNETFVAQTGGATTIGETTPTSGWVQGTYAKLSMSYDGKTFVLYGQRNSNGTTGLCAVFKLNPDTNIYNHVDNLTMYNSTLGLGYNNYRSGCGNEQGSYYPEYVSLSTDGKYITSNVWNESPAYYIFKYDESAGKYIRQKTIQSGGCVALNNTEAGISNMNPGGSYVIGSGQYIYAVGIYTYWWYLLKPTGTA